MVAAFLLTNKVWSPQYSLWLVPLAVLALPRWRLLLAWMTVDALVWAPRMLFYLGADKKGLPIDWFLSSWCCATSRSSGCACSVVYEIYHPAATWSARRGGHPGRRPGGRLPGRRPGPADT